MYVYKNKFLIFVIFIIISTFLLLTYILMDKKIYSLLILLLFNNRLFTFLKVGYEMEYETQFSYFYTIIIRIFILLYLVFSIFINFFYVLFTYHKYKYPINMQFYEITKNPLLIPNFECSLVNGISVAYNNIDLFMTMQNKLYWDNLFKKNNINTPSIAGIISNGIVKKNKLFNINKEYIVKPIVGGLGKNIMKYDENNIPNNNDYIIQEKIIQNDIKGHFRINTIYNKKVKTHMLSNIYLCLNAENKIASNSHNGGSCNEIDINKNSMRYLKSVDLKYLNFDIKNIKLKLKIAIEKAIKLHKTLPLYCISVGWDVMLSDNNYYFLEGNIPHGTVLTNDIYYYQKSKKINDIICESDI
jgi:hypothetical protein